MVLNSVPRQALLVTLMAVMFKLVAAQLRAATIQWRPADPVDWRRGLWLMLRYTGWTCTYTAHRLNGCSKRHPTYVYTYNGRHAAIQRKLTACGSLGLTLHCYWFRVRSNTNAVLSGNLQGVDRKWSQVIKSVCSCVINWFECVHKLAVLMAGAVITSGQTKVIVVHWIVTVLHWRPLRRGTSDRLGHFNCARIHCLGHI